jgi:hypothetical protein
MISISNAMSQSLFERAYMSNTPIHTFMFNGGLCEHDMCKYAVTNVSFSNSHVCLTMHLMNSTQNDILITHISRDDFTDEKYDITGGILTRKPQSSSFRRTPPSVQADNTNNMNTGSP